MQAARSKRRIGTPEHVIDAGAMLEQATVCVAKTMAPALCKSVLWKDRKKR